MCGINGYILNNNTENNYLLIQKMNQLINHRGPDDSGSYIDSIENKSIGMGMTRLSIIDLVSGNQPMFSSDNSIVIIFNGEIYNYKELKKDLALRFDIKFLTDSDTEVVLRLYETCGVKSFKLLDGMFSITIYDKNISKIYIARDYFGEKPLYYTKNNNGLIWGSELKSIISILKTKPSISKKALSLYFQLTYIPAPFTIYDNIYKLKANNYLEINIANSSYEEKLVHEEKQPSKNKKIIFEDAKKITHDLVMESVISRSISDVPIGTFLSGGVDSSIVSLCLAKNKSTPIDTFSIGFENKSFDETDKSTLVSKLIGSKHHQFIVDNKSIEKDINKVLLNFDEPFADSSALPTYMVSKLTSNHVKVALTGDGGDEVFGGYNKYYIGKLNKNYTRLIPEFFHSLLNNSINFIANDKKDERGIRYKFKRFVQSVNYNDDFYFNIISLAFQNNELSRLFLDLYDNNNPLKYFQKNNKLISINDFRNFDKIVSLEGDMLVKVDRVSMLNSIECRAPFLNKKIWDFTNSLPDDFLLNGWDKKHLLKGAFKDYFPKNFLNKSKKGFEIPVGDWLRTILKNELISFCNKDFLKEQNLFNPNYIIPIVANHLNSKNDNTFRVWTFYCFQKWYSQNYLSN